MYQRVSKKVLSLILVLAMLCGLLITSASAVETSGNDYNPTEITTVEQLKNMANDLDGDYILKSNLNIDGEANWTPVGTASAPFTGTFDGNGYTINWSLTVNNSSDLSYYGIFGYSEGVIANLKVTGNLQLSNSWGDYVGGIAGYSNGSIYGCTNAASVNAPGMSNIGGIAGFMGADATTKFCGNTGNLTGSSCVAGITGNLLSGGVIDQCYSRECTIWATSTTYGNSGGLAGYVRGTISNSYADNIRLRASSAGDMGGLVAVLTDGGTAENCYAHVESYKDDDGSRACSTSNAHSFVGGFGSSVNATLTNCYWDETASGYTQPTTSGTWTGGGKIDGSTITWSNVTSFTGSEFTTDAGRTHPVLTMEPITYDYDFTVGTVAWSGSGTEANPYLITSQAELAAIGEGLSATNDYNGIYFKLNNNIALTGNWTPIGGYTLATESVTGNSFAGTFDGNGKTISNLNISGAAYDHVGLFGSVAAAGTVKNLTVSSGTVTGNKNTGAIVGRNYGTVSNCSNTGCAVVSAGISQGVGGVVGSCWNTGTISGCSNSGTVRGITATTYTGGVVGKAEDAVTNCSNTGTVTGVDYTGGVVGYCKVAPTSCTNSGTVSCSGSHTGSIYGYLEVIQPISGSPKIDQGGTYIIEGNTDATVTTTDPVTIKGDATAYSLRITYDVAADLTIEDLTVSAPVGSSANIINFADGTVNTLTVKGTNLLENDNVAGSSAMIRVVNTATTSTSLTIKGNGTLYMYKNSMGSGIGGNTGEANGAITIDMIGGSLFIKGSKTGAVIGNDTTTDTALRAVIGDITIKNGNINLVNKAQGAGIGGSRMSIAGTCRITGGNVTLTTDFSAPVIGAGTQAKTTAENNGDLIVTGGSVKTMITNNAYSTWGLGDSPEGELTVPGSATKKYVINDAAIMADKTDGSNNAVYLYKFDTTSLSDTSFEVTVDGNSFYTGGLHQYVFADVTTSTEANWVTVTDNNLYLYLTGANHIVSVNGVRYTVTWNPDTKTFSTEQKDFVLDGTAGTNGTGTFEHPYNNLSDAVTAANAKGGQVIISGTVTVSADTALSTAFVSANGYKGTLFSVAADKVLTLNSGASITGNGVGADIYLASGSYITLGAAISSNITISLETTSGSPTVAKGTTSYNPTQDDLTKLSCPGYTLGLDDSTTPYEIYLISD